MQFSLLHRICLAWSSNKRDICTLDHFVDHVWEYFHIPKSEGTFFNSFWWEKDFSNDLPHLLVGNLQHEMRQNLTRGQDLWLLFHFVDKTRQEKKGFQIQKFGCCNKYFKISNCTRIIPFSDEIFDFTNFLLIFLLTRDGSLLLRIFCSFRSRENLFD